MMRSSGIGNGESTSPDAETAEGTLAEIRSAVMEGNTVFFLRLDGQSVFYTISAADSPETVILSEGDRVAITYAPGEGDLLAASAVERK